MVAIIVRLYCLIRFGPVSERVKGIESGVISEFEIIDRHGVVVGYWAFGHFDPNLPFGERCYSFSVMTDGH